MQKSFTVSVENGENYVTAKVTVFFRQHDASFSHEHGIKRDYEYIPHSVDIEWVKDLDSNHYMRNIPDSLQKAIKNAALIQANEDGPY